jgi:APA family basic amino acid/polyamine antiporter
MPATVADATAGTRSLSTRGYNPRVSTPGLSRSLGVIEATAIVVGTIIGTGIFLKPRVIASLLDSPGLIMGVWALGGLLSLLGALSYAELGALFPEAGGEYLFMRETYGPASGFLWAWTYFVCAKIGSIAALGAGFAIYLKAFLPLGGHSEQGAAIAAILSVTALNVLGVAVGGRFQAVLTALKVVSLLAVLSLAFASPSGSWGHLAPLLPEPHRGLVSSIGLALVAVLWAYDGWNDLVMVSGEIRNPERNVVRALAWGMATIVGLYLLVNLAYHYALTISEMSKAERVAEAAVAPILGPRGASVLSAIILVSILGALNGSILSGARIPFAAAKDGLAPASLGFVHPLYRTPSIALVVQAALACLLIVVFTLLGIGQFDMITDMVIFAEWAFYMMCCAAVVVLRRRRPDLHRPYRAWGYPYSQAIFVVCAAGLVTNSLIQAPRQSGAGLTLIALGLPVYFVFRRAGASPAP